MIIRDEMPADNETIFALTEAAFAPQNKKGPFSDGTEPHIINACCTNDTSVAS